MHEYYILHGNILFCRNHFFDLTSLIVLSKNLRVLGRKIFLPVLTFQTCFEIFCVCFVFVFVGFPVNNIEAENEHYFGWDENLTDVLDTKFGMEMEIVVDKQRGNSNAERMWETNEFMEIPLSVDTALRPSSTRANLRNDYCNVSNRSFNPNTHHKK